MNLLILQETSSYSLNRLIEEAKIQGVDAQTNKFSNLKLNIPSQGKTKILNELGQDITDLYDAFIFRSSKRADGLRYIQLAKSMNLIIMNRAISTLNQEYLMLDNGEISKIHNSIVLSEANVPVVASRVYFDKKDVNETTFPVIAKHTRSSHGEGVTLLNSATELVNFIEESEDISRILFQDFVQSIDEENNRFDLRVLMLGGEVLGAMKKSVGQEKVITNYSAGGNVEVFKINNEIKNICMKIVKVLRLDYVGIDIIFDNNKPLILEVNPAAQFEGFEKATGINVAKKIIEFMVKKKANIRS